MSFLTLDANVLVLRGKTKEGLHRELRCWPERGLIHIEDSLDNSYNTISVRTFLQRANALNETLGNSDPARDSGADPHLREEITRQVEQSLRLAEIAKIQGMPDDPSGRRAAARARKKTMHVGSGKYIM
jgi:hypothetical protein